MFWTTKLWQRRNVGRTQNTTCKRHPEHLCQERLWQLTKYQHLHRYFQYSCNSVEPGVAAEIALVETQTPLAPDHTAVLPLLSAEMNMVILNFPGLPPWRIVQHAIFNNLNLPVPDDTLWSTVDTMTSAIAVRSYSQFNPRLMPG